MCVIDEPGDTVTVHPPPLRFVCGLPLVTLTCPDEVKGASEVQLCEDCSHLGDVLKQLGRGEGETGTLSILLRTG